MKRWRNSAILYGSFLTMVFVGSHLQMQILVFLAFPAFYAIAIIIHRRQK